MVFGDVLTSPPYIDSIDYLYNQMLEYFWLFNELGVNGYDDFRFLRKIPMGFRCVPLEDTRIIEERFNKDKRKRFIEICRHIEKSNTKEANIVRRFFYDIMVHSERTYKLQKPGAYYICIIGNSMIRKVTIPSAEFLIDLFLSAGYQIQDRMIYEIRRHYMKFPRRNNSGKIKYDNILVFRR